MFSIIVLSTDYKPDATGVLMLLDVHQMVTVVCGGQESTGSPDKGVRPNPSMLAWVTNVSTSPNLYIVLVQTLGLV